MYRHRGDGGVRFTGSEEWVDRGRTEENGETSVTGRTGQPFTSGDDQRPSLHRFSRVPRSSHPVSCVFALPSTESPGVPKESPSVPGESPTSYFPSLRKSKDKEKNFEPRTFCRTLDTSDIGFFLPTDTTSDLLGSPLGVL